MCGGKEIISRRQELAVDVICDSELLLLTRAD